MHGNVYVVGCRVRLLTDPEMHQGTAATNLRKHNIEKGKVGVVISRSTLDPKAFVLFDDTPTVAIFVPDEWLQGE